MSRRDDLKARAASRNARRAVANAVTVAEAMDPIQARRMAIRANKSERSNTERRRAIKLLAGITDPAPDSMVLAAQALAHGQRDAAAKLDTKAAMHGSAGKEARKARQAYLTQARIHDRDAATARERQLEHHRRFQDQAEIDGLAKGRGETLMLEPTAIADFVRDDRGALARDSRGLPVVNVELATARRRKTGLDWLRDKGRIDRIRFETGQRLGRIMAEAAKAAEPGRGDETGVRATTGQGKASAGPSDWKLEAMHAHAKARNAVTSRLSPDDGAALWKLLSDICHAGYTVRDLARNDDWEACRIEERLKMGLAMVRFGLLVREASE